MLTRPPSLPSSSRTSSRIILAILIRGAPHGFGETVGDGDGDVEQGFGRADADRAYFVLRHMAAAAEQRQDPARVGVLATADVEAEPDAVVELVAALAAIREKLRYSNVPESLRGLGITFIVVGLMSLGFMAFSGISL